VTWMAAFWLLITAVAEAKPPPPAPPPPAAPSAPAPPTAAEHDAAFQPYTAALASGNHAAAADALVTVVGDAAKPAFHGEAWALLGDELAALGFPAAAVHAYAQAIRENPVFAAPKIATALELANKVGDDRELGDAFAHDVGIPVAADVRPQLAYLAARAQFQQDNLGAALGILMMVDASSPSYARAQNLLGVIQTNQGRPNDALAPLQLALATAPRTDDPEAFADAVKLNLARAYYAAGNFPRAIEYDLQVSRSSPHWPEAQFERAWAHFRIEDMPGTLGILEDEKTPFLADYWFPEGSMLRTYALFTMCKFVSATEAVDQFAADWQPRKDELDRSLSGYGPAEGWADVVAARKGGTTRLPAAVLRSWKDEERFEDAIHAVDTMDGELAQLHGRPESFATVTAAALQARRDAIVAEEGGRVVAKATTTRDQLGEMLGNIQLTRLDMMTMQTTLLEHASVTGSLDLGDRIGQLRKLRKNPKTRVWPFEGEYWADELGYYKYEVRSDCPADMAVGGQ
jgi:tetratricopeptide (TPR) repeat protein